MEGTVSLDQGLSQASGNTFLQDAQGFLWIGTQDGLNRWDGYGMEVFKRDPDDEASLAENFVVFLWEDSEGRFWVFHSTLGAITVLDPARRTFRRVAHRPEGPHCESDLPPTFNFRARFEDGAGRLWLGSHGLVGLLGMAQSVSARQPTQAR